MNASPTAASVHVGTPPPDFNGWTSTKIFFHGFANLSTQQSVPVASPKFMAVGNTWGLALYPGGRNNSREGWVAIYLRNWSNKSIDMNFGFSIKDGDDDQIVRRKNQVYSFGPRGSQSCGRGLYNFVERSTIVDVLVNGTLVVEVHMKLQQPAKLSPPQFIPENPHMKLHQPAEATLPHFIPENPFCNNMLQMLNDEDSADVVFAVGKQPSKNNAKKVAKIAPVKFHAHCLILNNAGSAILVEFCDSKGDPSTPIEITDVSPEVFRHLLYYIYGEKISDDDMKARTKEIIDAANRYGVATLKLEAEACLVVGTTFSLENVMEHLIYADSMNCALLKEVAMDYIMENKAEVLEKISFDDAPGNLTRDLLAAVVRGEREEGGVGGENENLFTTMRINELARRHMRRDWMSMVQGKCL